MAERGKIAGYFWFKFSVGFGLILGLLLLGQTVSTYRYVSSSLVHQEAQREADRRAQSVARATRLTGSREPATLTPVIEELIKESPEQIAWIRVLDTDGKVIASGGNLSGATKWTPETLRAAMSSRATRPDVQTDNGPVLFGLTPLRFAGGFGRNGGGPPTLSGLDRGGPPSDLPRVGPPPDLPVNGRGLGFGGQGFPGQDRGGGRGPSGDLGRGLQRLPAGPYIETAIYLSGVSINFAPLLQNLIVGCSAAIALLLAVVVIGVRFPHYIRGKQYDEEMALARRVQNDLFPAEGTPTGNVEFAARFIPSREVGGDLYDVFETDDGGVAIVLGDVSGKGLSAALLMGVVQGAVRTSSDTGLDQHHEYAAERLNHLMCMKTARERFVSLFWCYLNQEGNRLSYINAGHLPALLVRERFGQPDVWRLEQGGGPVMGVLPGARYRQAEVVVEPGDLLVVFSDGISEAANAAGDEFGEDAIIESVKRDWKNSAAGVCDRILSDVRAFLGKELPHDDQTLMVVRLERVERGGIIAQVTDTEIRIAT